MYLDGGRERDGLFWRGWDRGWWKPSEIWSTQIAQNAYSLCQLPPDRMPPHLHGHRHGALPQVDPHRTHRMRVSCTKMAEGNGTGYSGWVGTRDGGSFRKVSPHRTHRMHIPCTNFHQTGCCPSSTAIHGHRPGALSQVDPHRTHRMRVSCTKMAEGNGTDYSGRVGTRDGGSLRRGIGKLVHTDRTECSFRVPKWRKGTGRTILEGLGHGMVEAF
jgi:hypothetical protein